MLLSTSSDSRRWRAEVASRCRRHSRQGHLAAARSRRSPFRDVHNTDALCAGAPPGTRPRHSGARERSAKQRLRRRRCPKHRAAWRPQIWPPLPRRAAPPPTASSNRDKTRLPRWMDDVMHRKPRWASDAYNDEPSSVTEGVRTQRARHAAVFEELRRQVRVQLSPVRRLLGKVWLGEDELVKKLSCGGGQGPRHHRFESEGAE